MARIQDGNSNAIFDEKEAISFSLVALDSEANVELHGQAVAAVQIEGYTGTLTLAFEGSVDGSNYHPLTALKADDGTAATSTAADGLWFAPVGGLRYFRVRVSAFTSGSATVSVRAGYGGGTASYTPFGGTVSVSGDVDQGAPNTTANAWPIKVTDGTDLADVTAAGALKVDGSAVTQPVSDAGGSLTVDSPQLPGALGANGGLKIEGVASGTVVPVSDGGGTITVDDGGLSVSVDDGGLSLTVDGSVTADTELPAAAALADAAANPTAPAVDSRPSVYNGATWDRLRGNTSGAQVQGAAAHDAAAAGNPLLAGGEARTTNPTSVGDGDAVRLRTDKSGRLVTCHSQARDLLAQNTITLSSTTETTLLAAGGAGVFHDIVGLVLTNTSGTAVRVDFRDATGGTVRFSLFLAANGGGGLPPMVVAWPQTTANNNWTAQLSAAVTDVRIAILAAKNL